MKISHKFILFFLLSVVSIKSYAQPTQSAVDEVEKYKSKGYNVLFVAIDDLNDWVGCLGGNSQVKTPNIDRFAKENGIVFNKAYSPSTVCCPSRTALLSGKRVASTGVYGNGQNIKEAPKAKDVVTLPEYFGKHGYYTLSAGKVFHKQVCFGSKLLQRLMELKVADQTLFGELAKDLWKKPKIMLPANGQPISCNVILMGNHFFWRLVYPNLTCLGLYHSNFMTCIL
jgi:hypothetical protein